ncbi:hypoxanthine-guanine phosphoribosyltransferase [Methylococcaceae bacterium HT1]|nr:hypoxanthine-guanine phosphoribosyltransferase [Methylococcaceae bacterium HT1]TXL14611.1 hypoxanthine-guanine phosphoribosyltransferase [Methylococcaceae bacterium HT3]
MLNEIELIQKHARLLHTETEVEAALDLMAEDINSRLATTNPLILCVMNGGIVTTGKLMPRFNFPLTLDAINVSRYGEQTSGNELNWLQKPISSLKNRTILIIDDILDEGLTLEAIYQYCQEQGASQIYSAVLVEKQLNKSKPIQADFIGLSVADHYLYGYGMDYKGYLRNAAGIYACA